MKEVEDCLNELFPALIKKEFNITVKHNDTSFCTLRSILSKSAAQRVFDSEDKKQTFESSAKYLLNNMVNHIKKLMKEKHTDIKYDMFFSPIRFDDKIYPDNGAFEFRLTVVKND